jgi:hypothetical protein
MERSYAKGLPEPIVRALKFVVEIAWKLTGRKPPPPRRQRVALGVRKGTVYGKLTREEIYNNFA